MHPTLDLPALDCGGFALLKEIDALLERLPPYSEERDHFATALLGASEVLKIDGEGRFVMSDRMREVAGLTDQVAFVGHGHKFQIWEPTRFAAHYQESRERLRGFRKSLSVLSSRETA